MTALNITASLITDSSAAASAQEIGAFFATMIGGASVTFNVPGILHAPLSDPPLAPPSITGLPLRETPKPSLTSHFGVPSGRKTGV